MKTESLKGLLQEIDAIVAKATPCPLVCRDEAHPTLFGDRVFTENLAPILGLLGHGVYEDIAAYVVMRNRWPEVVAGVERLEREVELMRQLKNEALQFATGRRLDMPKALTAAESLLTATQATLEEAERVIREQKGAQA